MFKYLFALFALFAVAFAAPAANPDPNPAPQVITYKTVGYGGAVPYINTYGAYPTHVGVPTTYGAVPTGYVYGASPVVYG